MRMIALALLFALPAQAGSLTALHTLPAGARIAPDDLVLDTTLQGGVDDPLLVVGKSVRTTIYAGRPILPGNVETPTLVDRNQIVVLAYDNGALSIQTEGRALGKGGAGDVIRVLNVASKTTLSARINPDGTVSVLTR